MRCPRSGLEGPGARGLGAVVEAKGPPVLEHQKTTRFHVIGSIASSRL
jgi:hypothetical protein